MFASISGHTITSARVHMPAAKAWSAELEVDSAEKLDGQVTIQIGDLSLVGTIRRGAPHVGQGSYRVDGGAGSWGASVPAKGYRSDGGVMLSTVATDLASAVGESIASGYTDSSVGLGYARFAGRAEWILDELVGATGWYVDASGSTVLGTRPSTDVSIEHDVLEYHPGSGVAVVATEAPAGILPGMLLEVAGVVMRIVSVVLVLDGSSLRLRCSVVPQDSAIDDDRLALSVRRSVEAALHRFELMCPREYRVASVDGEYVDLEPVRPSVGAPPLRRVQAWPGLGGSQTEPAEGSVCLVQFIDGDPSRFYVAAYEGPHGGSWTPAKAVIDADSIELGDAQSPVVRYGEQVTVGSSAGPITFVSTLAAPALPIPGQSKVLA